jgi:hypothetical protein
MDLNKIFTGRMSPAKWRELGDYLRSQRVFSGLGVRITASTAGIIISAKSGPPAPPQKELPFEVSLGFTIEEEETSYYVTVADGRVIERRVVEGAGNQILWHKPNGIKDEENNPVKHPIEADQAVYVVYPVDLKGAITATPYVQVAADDVASTSYYPRVGAYAGAGGTYRHKLAKFVIEGDSPKLIFDQAGSHIDHIVERMEMVNLPLTPPSSSEGDFYQILKTYLPDLDQAQFRAICSLPVAGGASVVKDQTGDTVNLRRLAPRETAPQIQVSEDENAVRIEGNGVSGDNDAVTVEDGLVTAVKEFGAGGSGWWGTLRWQHFTNIADTDPYDALEADYENGILKEVRYQPPGDDMEVVTGTEIAPGFAEFTSFAD